MLQLVLRNKLQPYLPKLLVPATGYIYDKHTGSCTFKPNAKARIPWKLRSVVCHQLQQAYDKHPALEAALKQDAVQTTLEKDILQAHMRLQNQIIDAQQKPVSKAEKEEQQQQQHHQGRQGHQQQQPQQQEQQEKQEKQRQQRQQEQLRQQQQQQQQQQGVPRWQDNLRLQHVSPGHRAYQDGAKDDTQQQPLCALATRSFVPGDFMGFYLCYVCDDDLYEFGGSTPERAYRQFMFDFKVEKPDFAVRCEEQQLLLQQQIEQEELKQQQQEQEQQQQQQQQQQQNKQKKAKQQQQQTQKLATWHYVIDASDCCCEDDLAHPSNPAVHILDYRAFKQPGWKVDSARSVKGGANAVLLPYSINVGPCAGQVGLALVAAANIHEGQEVTISYGKDSYWQEKANNMADVESFNEGRLQGRLEAAETIKELKQQLKQQADNSAVQQERQQQLLKQLRQQQQCKMQLLQELQKLQQAVGSAVCQLAADGQEQKVCGELAAAGKSAAAVLAGSRLAGQLVCSAGSVQQASNVPAASAAAAGAAAAAATAAASGVATVGIEDSQQHQQQQSQQQEQQVKSDSLKFEEDLHWQQQQQSTELLFDDKGFLAPAAAARAAAAPAGAAAGAKCRSTHDDQGFLAPTAATAAAAAAVPAAAPAAAAAPKAKRRRRQPAVAWQHSTPGAVLGLVLQNAGPALSTAVETVCSMLCCSKVLQAVVHQQLAGQLAVSVMQDAKLPAFAQWFVRHGCLLQQLQLDLHQQQQEDWLQLLSGLTQLTSLNISNVRSVQLMAQLPVQLQRLQVHFHSSVFAAAAALESLSLCHMTAVKELVTNYQPERCEYVWTTRGSNKIARLLLPSSLQLLTLQDCRAAAPLLALQQTQLPLDLQQPAWGLAAVQLQWLQLEVRDGCLPASELRDISKLTGLSELSLTYSSIATAVGAADAWGKLPLKQLSITASSSEQSERNMQLPTSAVHQLTGLTSLSLADCRVSAELLGAVADACTALQVLQLQQCRGVRGRDVAAAVMQLQQLRRLDVRGTLGADKLAKLARAAAEFAPQLVVEADSSLERGGVDVSDARGQGEAAEGNARTRHTPSRGQGVGPAAAAAAQGVQSAGHHTEIGSEGVEVIVIDDD